MTDIFDRNVKNVTYKPLYILTVQDSEVKGKARVFACTYTDKNAANFLSIRGYELTGKKHNELRSIEQVEKYAEEEKLEPVEFIFPWQCVKSLQNVSFKINKKGEKNEQ